MLCRISASFMCVLAVGFAQDYRGQINGRVLDPSGAAIPGASVSVTNVATNSPSATKSDESGNYRVLYLSPGQYSISVEHSGFKKLIRKGIEVRVGDQLLLDLNLEVGTATETVNVTADAALLETNTASTGQVIDQKRIQDLPLSDGNPFVLHRLAPGVIYTGDLKFSRPFDNGGTSSITVDGAPGGNEFTLDGSPNMASGRRVAYVPPRDTVEEFKVETSSFDAQDGHTAGGTVNVALKSGTNNVHGTLYEFLRNDKLSANDFFLNRSGRPRDTLRYNLYGGTVGGPVWIPKIYNGKNRTFFFFGFEGIKDRFPEPTNNTVPTNAQRNGDMSALLGLGAQYQVYDPQSARAVANGRIQRDPFAGNIIPQNRISAISKNYLNLYPLPNQAGDREGRNNFLSANVRGDDFHSETYRFDHQITTNQKAFARVTYNNRRESRGNWSGVTNNVRATGNFLFRINTQATFDHVWTMSPTTVLNWRVGFSRFEEPSIRQHEGNFDPASLGFAPATVALFAGSSYVPRFEIGNYTVLGDSIGGGSNHNIYSFQPTLTKVIGGGKHQVRVGFDGRSYRENAFGPGHAAGRYDFGTNFTRGPLDNSPAAPMGLEFASFLLGQTTGGIIDRNASRSNQVMYYAAFIHDDYKVSTRLTLNLGLRYEYEGGLTERYDRNTRGFDLTTSNPLEAAAKTAYAASPIPQIAASAFQVKGGYLFAGSNGRGVWTGDKNNFQPRIGIAYKLGNRTVFRGGFGMYMVPFIIAGVNQAGFSQATNIVPSLDGGVTFAANLANPFPSGAAAPPGASRGLLTFVSRGVSNVPLDANNGMSRRVDAGFQHELPGRVLLDAGYVGTWGYNLNTTTNLLNAVPKQYLSTSAERDQATIDFLSTNVANPFRDLLPGESLNSSVTSRGQLLRPFPQFTGISTAQYDGWSGYHSLQWKVEKRFAQGWTLLASYTLSKLKERVSYLNDQDTQYEERLNGADRRQRIIFSGMWELPVGKGRRFGSGMHPVANAVLGGWLATGIAQFQTGGPLNFDSNYLFRGDRNSVALGAQENIDRWFNTDGFEKTAARQLANNLRTAPRQFPGVQGQGLNLWDLSVIKSFQIREGMRLQFRTEFLNAFNHPQFNDPERNPTNSNFGRSTGQGNLPRNIQLALKLMF